MRPKLQSDSLHPINFPLHNYNPPKPNLWGKAKDREKTYSKRHDQRIFLPSPKTTLTPRNHQNFPHAFLNNLPSSHQKPLISLPSHLFHPAIRYFFKKNISFY